MSEKMSSCLLPFRRKWCEEKDVPHLFLKQLLLPELLRLKNSSGYYMCSVAALTHQKKKKSNMQFCSTVISPNCPIPLVLYFLVDGVDLVGNWSVRRKVIAIWLCFLTQLSVEFPVCEQPGSHCAAAGHGAGQGVGSSSPHLLRKCSAPLPSLLVLA